jgi:hypothetical protein
MFKNFKAGRIRVLFPYLLLFGPALLLVFIGTRGCEHKFQMLDDFGKAADYSFTASNGKKYTSADFKGELVIVSTIQETCPDSCGVSLWHMNHGMYQHIRKNKGKRMKGIRMISFATDGAGNPIKDLSVIDGWLKDNVEEYDPEIWLIASGDARSVFNFEHNGESLLKEGKQYFGGQSFQELLLLLDKDNHLRMVLSGQTEGMIRRMKQHIALLQKQYDKERAHPTK